MPKATVQLPLCLGMTIRNATGRVFHLKTLLGEGSYGQVWTAKDPISGGICAVKVVAEACTNAVAIQRELEIAKLASSIVGPHHVPQFFEGCAATIPELSDLRVYSVVTELVDGKNAQAVIERRGTMDGITAAVTLRDVSFALSCLHRNHILHNDIKTDNIILARQGRAYLCDFGFSKDMKDANLKDHLDGGTAEYIAPELLDLNLPVTERHWSVAIDIWALGITAIRLVTGKCPWQGASRDTLFHKLRSLPPPKLHQRGGLTKDIAAFTERCLVHEPKERACATELLKLLTVEAEDREHLLRYLGVSHFGQLPPAPEAIGENRQFKFEK